MSQNPYLDTLEDTGTSFEPKASVTPIRPAAKSNPYLDTLEQTESAQGAVGRASVRQAVTVNPDQYAKDRRMAASTGLPVDVVSRNPDEVKRRIAVQEYETLQRYAPKLAAQMRNPDFAKIAHDSVSELSTVEKASGAGGSWAMGASGSWTPDRTVASTARDVGVTVLKGAVGLPQAVVGLASILTGGSAGRLAEQAGFRPNATQKILDELYSPAQQAANKAVRGADGFLSTLSAAVQNPSVIGTTVVESLPQMLGGMAVARGLLRVAPSLSPLIAGAVGEGTVAAGSAAEQIRGQTVDNELTGKQSLASVLSGVGTAVFGVMGGKLAQRFGVDDIDTALARGGLDRAAVEQAKQGFVRRLAQGAITEGAFEELPQSVQEQMWQNFAMDKPLLEGVGNAAAMGLLAGAVTGGGFSALVGGGRPAQQELSAERAEQNAQTIEQITKIAAASKVRERDAGSFAEFVKAAKEDGPVQDVQINAAVFVQAAGENLATFMQTMPSVAEQMQEAIATNGELVIPLEEFTAHATEIAPKLIDDLRTSPDAMTRNEAKTFMQESAANFEQEATRVLEEKEFDTAFKESAATVEGELLAQLKQANRFTDDVNAPYAKLAGAFYTVQAARLGITPEEMYVRYPLVISAEGLGGGRRSIDQGVETPAFQRWFGESKVVDAQGKPLVVYHGTRSDFTQFDPAKIDQGETEAGFYFSSSAEHASDYVEGESGANVMPSYLKINNPYEVSADDWNYARGLDMRSAQEQGYDGYVIRDQLGGDTYVVFDPTQIKSAIGNSGAFDPQNPNILKQPAYHGSPHDFDRFSTEAIGTGEGAQAYGWGLYFAENPGIAAGYHERLAGNPQIEELKLGTMRLTQRNGFDYSRRASDNSVENVRASLAEDLLINEMDLRGAGDAQTYVLKVLDERIANYYNPELDQEMIEAAKQLRKELARKGAVSAKWEKATGGVYQVDIPDEAVARMLDWDKPLSEQAPAVRQAVEAYFKANAPQYWEQVESDFVEGIAHTGQSLYNAAVDVTGSQEQASRELLAAGIPGIKYDDAGSRDKEGTHNIVVFDEKIVTITHKDGTPLTKQERKDFLEQNQGGTRGQISFDDDITKSPSVITLLNNADLSTFVHELGHFQLEVLAHIASQPDAPAEIVADMDRLLKWFEVPGDDATGRLTNWNLLTLDEKRPYHEQLARGFEAYLFEGNAPSIELNDIFARMRAWLINVYKQLTALNVTLTDEVRGVFDRLIATNEEILAAEQQRGYKLLFNSAEEMGATPAEWKAYQEQGQAATQEAVDQLGSRSLRDMRWVTNTRSKVMRKLQRDADQKRKEIDAEVTAEVQAMPVYAAQRFMAEHKDNAAPEVLPLVAERFGFTSADHLTYELGEAQPEAIVIDALVDQRMLERYGDLSSPQAIERAADAAIHNDARGRFIATELNALQKATGKSRVLAKAAKEFAAAIIARKKIRAIKPAQYSAAEARAGRAAEKAKSITEKATEKRNQLVNHYAARSAHEALEYVETQLAYLKKVGTRETIDIAYRDQIDAMLERFDLRQVTNKDAAKRAKLADWIKAQEAAGFEPTISDEMRDEAFRKPYREMTVEEFKGLVDAVKNIEHLGRLKNKLLTAKDEREFDAAVTALATTIQDNAKGVRRDERISDRGFLVTVRKLYDKAAAIHRKFASLARGFDGYKDGGVAWNYLVRNMNAAGNFEAAETEKATAALIKLISPVMKGGKLTERQYFPDSGKSFSREERIGIALNMGNEVNRERVLTGEGLQPQQLDSILKTLTKADWDFVQGVWDYFDTFRSLIAAKERRVSGTEPEWVEAAPVTTPFGEYRGGYYPIAYDPVKSERSSADLNAEVQRQIQQGLYTRAQTRRGHTKARSESTGRTLRYDFGEVITRHVTQVIHDLAWHEYLIDANRLLRAPAIENAVRAHYGVEVLTEMKDTLKDIAIGNMPAEKGAVYWNHLRYGATIAGLGWNVFNSLQNISGLTQSASRIGSKWVFKGAAHWAGDALKFESAIKDMREKSALMRERGLGKTLTRDINDIRNKVTGKSSQIEAAFFYLQTKTQVVVDVPTWWGAYEKAMAQDDMTEDRAVALADQAVLDSQGGGQVKDQAGIQRGGAGLKLFTAFYSYFNLTLNLTAEAYGRTDFKKPGQVALFAGDMLLLYTLPALYSTLLKAALQGDWDDEEKLTKKIIGDQISFALGTVVGLREAAAAFKELTGTGEGFGYSGPASVRFFSDLTKLGQQTYQVTQGGEFDEAFWKSLNNTAGVLFHYPAGQINRTASGIAALSDGRTENPLAVVMGAPRS